MGLVRLLPTAAISSQLSMIQPILLETIKLPLETPTPGIELPQLSAVETLMTLGNRIPKVVTDHLQTLIPCLLQFASNTKMASLVLTITITIIFGA